ncbi:hypothetical protein DDE82_004036 [Stemphylium lycopersici]|nr:hypothetical protein DDE82_004036 [Stemphylium lycopersici]
MSASQTFTGDLRSDAKEFNRDKNNRAKWAHGQSFGPGRREEDGKPRPAKLNVFKSSYPGHMKARTALNKDMAFASDESSADEDVEHPSAAPAPDAEIAYSYDAPRGPSHGSQILHYALDKAVERFETKEIEKLVKNEYEVLDIDDDTPRSKRRVAPEDEEYEFIDA